ncbi:MAG: hypothetical protein QM770_05565 [Tepidisphaeraceae bacterium]
MQLRRKSVRRLAILLSAVTATCGTLAGVYFYKTHQRTVHLDELARTGLDAYNRNDFVAALPKLHDVVVARPTDLKTMYAYAVSRANVEVAGGQHLVEARLQLAQLLRLDPNNEPARRLLMQLQLRSALYGELLESADTLLHQKPADAEALNCRATALSALDRKAEAVDAWTTYAAAAPNDLQGQVNLLAAMRRAGRTSQQVIEQADRLAKQHPDDVRFLVPLAEAQRFAGDRATALELLKKAAAAPSAVSDWTLTRALLDAFDRLNEFGQSQALLDRAAQASQEPAVIELLAERLWQSGRYREALDTLGRVNAPSPRAVALRATAQWELGDHTAARQNLAQLALRSDNASLAWSTALNVVLAEPTASASDRVTALRSAMALDADNAVFHRWLGSALAELGETDLAVTHLDRAADLMPSWPLPPLEESACLLHAGRVVDSVRAATEAVRRAPQLRATQVQFALARFAAIDAANDPVFERTFLDEVTQLRARVPDDATLLAVQVGLLARQTRTEEAKTLARDFAASHALTPSQTRDLLIISQRYGLDLGQDLLARSPTLTPELALAAALDTAVREGPAAARAAFAKDAGTQSSTVAWRLASARLALGLNDADAPAQWTKLGDDFPSDLSVQAAVLDEAHDLLAGDRAFLFKSVDRLKQITGEDGRRWRLERHVSARHR